MFNGFPEWCGDLYRLPYLSEPLVGVICILTSAVCGGIVGVERERSDKPAGLRTHILICMGATVFTLSSILIAHDFPGADRARIAAQVVAGVGFLGAGAIIHERRAIQGLTTAATIWSVAAVGVVIGVGFPVAGLVVSLLIYLVLSTVKALEARVAGACCWVPVRVRFRSNRGKTRALVLGVLDDFSRRLRNIRFSARAADADGEETVEFEHCTRHRMHRSVLAQLAQLDGVTAIEEIGTGLERERASP